MKRIFISLLAACLGLFSLSVSLGEGAPVAGTIQRAPFPLEVNKYNDITVTERFIPNENGVIDLLSLDLSDLDLTPYSDRFPLVDFDDRTLWPDTLPEGFDPELLMALGKDPGLGVRELHRRGITGKGIGIGIIDNALLVGHQEYKDRLRFYEENELYAGSPASTHGAAVASIALGESVGVAPDALLYFIAELASSPGIQGGWVRDCTYYAAAIERFLALNEVLPEEERIRVISISMGWQPEHIGVAELEAAIRRAKDSGIAICAISDSQMAMFGGMSREPYGDPNDIGAVRPGLGLLAFLHEGIKADRVNIPMDFRCLASPTGEDEYAHYAQGGQSWVMPWIAGLYALALEAAPETTFEEFTAAIARTAIPVSAEYRGKRYQYGFVPDVAALMDSLTQ